MDPLVQLVIGLLSGAVAVLGGVVGKLYLDLRAERAARLEDAREHTRVMVDFQGRLHDADADEIHRLRERVDSLLDPDEAPSARGRRKAKP